MSSSKLKGNVDAELIGEAIEKGLEEKGVPVKPKKLMYVGPATKHIPPYSIYEGELPNVADNFIKECPAFKGLFISPDKLAEFQIKLAESTTVESMFYKKAEQYLSEVK